MIQIWEIRKLNFLTSLILFMGSSIRTSKKERTYLFTTI